MSIPPQPAQSGPPTPPTPVAPGPGGHAYPLVNPPMTVPPTTVPPTTVPPTTVPTMTVPPPLAPTGQRLAEFTDRLLARIIDVAVLGAASAVVVIPVYLVTLLAIIDPYGGASQLTGEDVVAVLLPLLGVLALLFLLSLALAYLYEVEMMFRSGQTIGKRAMKIQVIPVDPGLSLTRGHAARRFLVQHVAVAFVPLLNWVDGLWQLWDKPYRQCLHDKFATTVVIKLEP